MFVRLVPKRAAVGLLAALVVMATPATLVAATVSRAPVSADFDAASPWSSGSLIDAAMGSPTSVSCPTTSFCVAVDASG